MKQNKFDWVWQGGLALIVIVGEGVAINNITSFLNGNYCYPVLFPNVVFHCNYIAFAEFALSIIVSIGFINVVYIWIEKLRKIFFSFVLFKVRIRFDLSSKNDLKLYISNPKYAKPVFVSINNRDLLNQDGNKYIWDQDARDELKHINNFYAPVPILESNLSSNDTREEIIGKGYNGKIALKFYSDSSFVFGFRDGTYEYVVSCGCTYKKNRKVPLKDRSIWLVIKDGALVEIKEKL